jgi:hypothetical protein
MPSTVVLIIAAIPGTGPTQESIMDTTATTATTTESTSAPATARTASRRNGTRLLALLFSVAAALGVGLVEASSASAAVAPTNNFYADCNATSVTAMAPDMGYYPYNSVRWAPRLFIWTAAGWQPYWSGPTQVALGDNVLNDPWSITGSWMQESVNFPNLPHGYYYQVRVTYSWAGPNSAGHSGVDALVAHEVAQGNFNFASYSKSTSGYCFVP